MSFSNRYCSRHYAGATVKPSYRMVVFFLVICLVASLSGCGDQTDHTGEAKIPLAPSMMEGKDYTEVLEKFEEAGHNLWRLQRGPELHRRVPGKPQK